MLNGKENSIEFRHDLDEWHQRYVFLHDQETIDERIVLIKLAEWKEKYPEFGIICTNIGLMVDTFKTKSRIGLPFSTDQYYQHLLEGVIVVKDEHVNPFI